MGASNHLNASIFQRFTDTGILEHSFFFPYNRQPPTYITLSSSLTSLSIFFQNSIILIRFFGICTFASITGHHCSQKCVRRIFLEKVTTILKGLQTFPSHRSNLYTVPIFCFRRGHPLIYTF